MQNEEPLSIDSLMSKDQPYQDIPNTINSGKYNCRGGFRGGGRTRRASSLKLEKIWFFWGKIVIFHTKYPKNFRASLRNWKKYDFLA